MVIHRLPRWQWSLVLVVLYFVNSAWMLVCFFFYIYLVFYFVLGILLFCFLLGLLFFLVKSHENKTSNDKKNDIIN